METSWGGADGYALSPSYEAILRASYPVRCCLGTAGVLLNLYGHSCRHSAPLRVGISDDEDL